VQVKSLEILEEENRAESSTLEENVRKGEALLAKVQEALSTIATHLVESSNE
jgi:hypothetical protein